MPLRASLHLCAGLLLLSVLASGCGSTGGAASSYRDQHPLPTDTMRVNAPEIGGYGGRFVIGQTVGPKVFNAMLANEQSSTDVTNLLFTGLTDFDNGTQQDGPLLAKSWELAPDGLTWTFHLRRGAQFSDGHPISSEDVLFSFMLAYDPVVNAPVQALIKMDGKPFELSAPDSYTVVIKTPAPNALLIPFAGAVRIMPKHVLEGPFKAGTYSSTYGVNVSPDSLVTSGAFRLKQYVSNEKTVLTRNPYWFGVDAGGHRLPYLDELVFLIVPDQDAADLKFRAGEVDAVDDVKPENYKWYEDNQKQGSFTLYDLGPGLNTNMFWFNLNRVRKATAGKKVGDLYVDPVKYAWFNDLRFRKAISMAVDREAMIPSVFFGAAVKNWSTSTPGNKAWYSPDIKKFDYDLEGSKKLFASMGWKDKDGDGVLEDTKGHPISFSIKTNSSNKLRVAMGNFIKDDLAKVGVKVTLMPVEFNSLISNLRENYDYESILLGLQSGVPPDPAMGQNVWRSSGRTHYWNVSQPRPETPQEARIDQLVDQNISTNDTAVRHATWKEIQDTVNDQCWLIWLPALTVKVPVRDRFGNVQPSVIPHRILWNIDRVYVKARAGRA
jgi:peptide/nickel transport system substrate-binding protein